MATKLHELPDEIQDLIRPHLVQSPEMLDAISLAIATRRDEAKAARLTMGIEQVWRNAEEAYVGIDDANRHEFLRAKWSKPVSMDGPVTTDQPTVRPEHKSTAFVRLTARYVDAGAAKLGEILLPVDDKAFSFSETPVPELEKAKDDKSQVVHDGMGGVPLTRPLAPGEAPPPPAPPVPPMAGAAPPVPAAAEGAVPPAAAAAQQRVPLTVADLAKENVERANKLAKQAETKVYDWLVECHYQAEMRKVIFDCARIGVGVLKGPFPQPKRGIKVSKTGNSVDVKIQDTIQPAAKAVDPWNIFPDPACGENIHNGDFVFELDYISERQLRELKRVPGYISKQIDRVLLEGPKNSTADMTEGPDGTPTPEELKNRFAIWYYYGTLKADELQCLSSFGGKPFAKDELPDGSRAMDVIVTMVNDCAIRATINPLDSGQFPYHSVPWQRRAGNWAGIGVAEQAMMPQRMVNAATRAMLNNAGISAGAQIVMNRSAISPADGQWQVTPNKLWNVMGEGGLTVEEAFQVYEIPNATAHMMSIIEYGMRLAEESTSIPLVTQGQSGKTTPQTFGATQLQDNNANQLLRSIGYAWDDFVTEPVVRQFYEWYLLDPDIKDEDKGEFMINAHGSAALVERAIQDEFLATMGAVVKDPAFGIDPKKWAEMMMRSKRITPSDLLYTKEQQEKIDTAPPPVAPQIEVAKIRAGVDQAKLEAEVKDEAEQRQLDREGLKLEHVATLQEMKLRHDLAMLDYANRNGITLQQTKTDLAKTAMTLAAQKELNLADNAVKVHGANKKGSDAAAPKKQPRPQRPPQPARPLANPPGRAANGEAFSQVGS